MERLADLLFWVNPEAKERLRRRLRNSRWFAAAVWIAGSAIIISLVWKATSTVRAAFPDAWEAAEKWGTGPVPVWALLLALAAFLALWLYVFRLRCQVPAVTFEDDFAPGWDRNWEVNGTWSTELDEDGHQRLVVTGSEFGGLAKPCRLWSDYVFEFETMIVHSCTTWIVRAADLNNYVMLQCGPEAMRPHWRMNGTWLIPEPPIPHPVKLPVMKWFGVRIAVRGEKVVVHVYLEGVEHALFDQPLMQPNIMAQMSSPGAESSQSGVKKYVSVALSFPMGSIGFRNSGPERAYFRNLRVARQ